MADACLYGADQNEQQDIIYKYVGNATSSDELIVENMHLTSKSFLQVPYGDTNINILYMANNMKHWMIVEAHKNLLRKQYPIWQNIS